MKKLDGLPHMTPKQNGHPCLSLPINFSFLGATSPTYLPDHHLLPEGAAALPGDGAGQAIAGARRDDADRNLTCDCPVLPVKQSVVDLVYEAVPGDDDDGSPSPEVL